MADRLYRVSLLVIPWIFVLLTRAWFFTCRLKVVGNQHLKAVLQQGTAVAVFWHYSFPYLFYHLRPYPAAIMVSASRDGEYIARVASLLGHVPLRGSSNRGGVRALKGMILQMQEGKHAGIVADGSQGPARKVQPGCILLASKSGKPIFPMVWSASRYLAFKSWDRTAIPLPFAKIYLHYGEPLFVPAGIGSDELEQYRILLEKRMNTLYTSAWEAAGRNPHDQELN